MKFYYENNIGDYGVFLEDDLVKAIYTAWNIEADLYLIKDNIERLHPEKLHEQIILIFAPLEGNEFNSDILKDYGYFMDNRGQYREIIDIKTNEVKKYEWSEVRQLV